MFGITPAVRKQRRKGRIRPLLAPMLSPYLYGDVIWSPAQMWALASPVQWLPGET
jgi:hypothetical protein